jgi:hypothetical protein
MCYEKTPTDRAQHVPKLSTCYLGMPLGQFSDEVAQMRLEGAKMVCVSDSLLGDDPDLDRYFLTALELDVHIVDAELAD